MTWLGQRNSSYEPERFPEGEINGAQLTTIVTLDDRQFGRITGVNPGGGVIRKLTETIREVHLRIERGRNLGGRQCVLWMNEQGKVIASAVVINDSGEAESYWNKPHSLERFGGSPDVTTRHEYGMWSLGNHGAVRQTRNFIREHYVTERPDMSSINIKVYPMLMDEETFSMSINGSSLGVYFRTYDDVVHVANEIAAKAISPSGVVTIDYHACLA